MKNIQNSEKTSCRHKLFAASIAAFCTSMIATSVTQASDIDIYQEAKSGQITLMFMLDISGSMGAPQLTGDAEACDVAFPATVTGNGSITSTNGIPNYTRYYCTGRADRTYKFRRYVQNNQYRYQRCTNDSSRIESCTWGSATTSTNNLPAYDSTETNSSYTY